jgi:hypothetical protein
VIVVAGLLLYEGFKLLVQPIISGAQDGVQEMSNDAVKGVARKFVSYMRDRFGVAAEPVPKDVAAHAPDAAGGTKPTPEHVKPDPLEAAVVAAIERGGDADSLLSALGTDAGTSGVGTGEAPGSDAWFVSAYEAVLWRVAAMAGWEARPIAVAGALQGPDWVTVCVPHRQWSTGQVVDPSSMWKVTVEGDRRRLKNPPVDFFVRVDGNGQSASDIEQLNREFIRTRCFDAGPASPNKGAWHRVDGLSRGWVLLQWDDALRAHIQKLRAPNMLDGGYLFPVELEARPPEWGECPQDWQFLMGISDPVAGIAGMRSGADAYAAAANTSVAAAKAALGLD